MTKRPRFAANLQVPPKGPPRTRGPTLTVVTEPEPAVTIDAKPELQALPQVAVPQEDTAGDRQPDAADRREQESLASIFGDAFAAMSLASYAGLTQGLTLQLRLSAYILGLKQTGTKAR